MPHRFPSICGPFLNRANTAGIWDYNKGSGPCIIDLDPDLATKSAISLPCTYACPGIQAL